MFITLLVKYCYFIYKKKIIFNGGPNKWFG